MAASELGLHFYLGRTNATPAVKGLIINCTLSLLSDLQTEPFTSWTVRVLQASWHSDRGFRMTSINPDSCTNTTTFSRISGIWNMNAGSFYKNKFTVSPTNMALKKMCLLASHVWKNIVTSSHWLVTRCVHSRVGAMCLGVVSLKVENQVRHIVANQRRWMWVTTNMK